MRKDDVSKESPGIKRIKRKLACGAHMTVRWLTVDQVYRASGSGLGGLPRVRADATVTGQTRVRMSRCGAEVDADMDSTAKGGARVPTTTANGGELPAMGGTGV